MAYTTLLQEWLNNNSVKYHSEVFQLPSQPTLELNIQDGTPWWKFQLCRLRLRAVLLGARRALAGCHTGTTLWPLGGNNSTHTTSEMLSYRRDQIRSQLVGERTKRPRPANQIGFPTQHHRARLQREPLRGGRAERKQAGDQPAGVGALRIRVFICV